MKFERRGVMLVIASPSGAGKSSVTRRLLAADTNLSMSVSVTTRAMRAGEVDGKDYHFIAVEKFREMVDKNELLESAEVHGNFYGTPKAQVDETLANGGDVVFDIDYQGTQQLARQRGSEMVSIFLLPPSIPELQSRLRGRALDSEEVIAKRLKNARIEIEHWGEYDYVLINQDLDETCAAVTKILETSRMAQTRQEGLASFVKELQGQIDSL